MEEKDKLEKTFKEKLEDYKVPVVASAWAGVEAALGNATTTVAGSISTLFYAAAVVGSVVFTTAIVSHNSSEKEKNRENIALIEENNNQNNNEPESAFEGALEEDQSTNESSKGPKRLQPKTTDLIAYDKEKYIVKEIENKNSNNKETITIKVEKVSENKLYTKINTSISGGYAPLKVSFSHESSPNTKVKWNFGDKIESFTDDPTHVYYRPGVYKTTIVVTDKNGKTAVDFINIEVKEGSSLSVTSKVITPNGDGLNDEITIAHKNIVEFSFTVLNSSGKEIFETRDINKTWKGLDSKGRPLPLGTYPYVLKAKGVDGKEYDQSGQITLLENYRP